MPADPLVPPEYIPDTLLGVHADALDFDPNDFREWLSAWWATHYHPNKAQELALPNYLATYYQIDMQQALDSLGTANGSLISNAQFIAEMTTK